jgi:hypothetical protein
MGRHKPPAQAGKPALINAWTTSRRKTGEIFAASRRIVLKN